MHLEVHLIIAFRHCIFDFQDTSGRNSKAILCLCKGAKVCNCHLWSECMTSFSQKRCWAPARHHHLAERHQMSFSSTAGAQPRGISVFFFRKSRAFLKGEISRFFVVFVSRWSTMVHESIVVVSFGSDIFDARAPI